MTNTIRNGAGIARAETARNNATDAARGIPMTIETIIKWFMGLLFGGVAVIDILLIVACSKLERGRRRNGKD